MQIDIRKAEDTKISFIIFSDREDDLDANKLYLDGSCTEIQSNVSCVMIDSKEDALNLIKALQKAIELGNWE